MKVILIPDSYTTMVNLGGHLEDENLEVSQSQEDGPSEASVSIVTPDGKRQRLRNDTQFSSSDDDENEGRGSHDSPRILVVPPDLGSKK